MNVEAIRHPRCHGARYGAAAALAAATVSLAVPLHAQDRGEGPATLFLTYECRPENRAAFRSYAETAGVGQFERWKQERVFQDYLILFSSYVNDGTWDMLVRLDFDAYAGTEKWKAIERTMPGGLSPEALALCPPARSCLMDLTWTKSGPSRDPAKAVYLVAPHFWWRHKTQNKRAVYKLWFESKDKKEYDGWVDEGSVSWYGAYINQNTTDKEYSYGKPWSVLLLFEYRGPVALARQELVRQIVRKELRSSMDQGWGFAQEAASPFSEEVILADPILPR